MTSKKLEDYILALKYADFVGFLNQWNSPPGAYSTLSKLSSFSNLNEKSRLLEIGCSTGFSSREFSEMTNCQGVGIDISEQAISMAKCNQRKYSKARNIEYKVENGETFIPSDKFTHIMVGGNLKFFGDPANMMNRCAGFLEDGGYILASPYYEIKSLPDEIVRQVGEVLGLSLESFDHFSYKDVMQIYNILEITFEERNKLTQETDKEIESYCNTVIDNACEFHSICDSGVKNVMLRKLLDIRKLINKTRPYQEYVVLVLRYRKSVYPRRFVPLY